MERRMRARVLRALFLLFVVVMLAVYAAAMATGAPPATLPDNVQIVIEQWC
jgi:hypothetical protein